MNTVKKMAAVKFYLPEECIIKILSYATPKEASKFATLSTEFRSIADSDEVWENFVPSDYEEILSEAQYLEVDIETMKSMPKKELYLYLCDNPINIANGELQFSLDKPSGKKQFLVKPNRFELIYSRIREVVGLTPEYRLSELAYHNMIYEFGYKADMESKLLSPQTKYGIYFLYRFEHSIQLGTVNELCLNIVGKKNEAGTDEDEEVIMIPSLTIQARCDCLWARESREDGLKEVMINEFLNIDGHQDYPIWCSIEDYICHPNGLPGLAFEGFEVRPIVTP